MKVSDTELRTKKAPYFKNMGLSHNWKSLRLLFGVTYCSGRFLNHIQRCRIFNRCRSRILLTIGNLSHGRAENLSGPGLWKARNRNGALEARERADLLSHHFHEISRNVFAVAIYTGFGDKKGDGDLALELVFYAYYCTFGHIGMLSDYFLHGSRRQPMACHIDDVIDPAHNVDISIMVEVAAVSGEIISGKALV